MILTERFKAKSGFLYDIQWHETGLEAYPSGGQVGAAGLLLNCQDALAEWCEECKTLGHPAN